MDIGPAGGEEEPSVHLGERHTRQREAKCKALTQGVVGPVLETAREASEAETDLEGLGSSRRVGQAGER